MKKILSIILVVSLISVFGYGYFYEPKTAKAGFTYSRSVTINHNKVASSTAETYANFPVMISSSTLDSLKTVANGGHVENTNGYDVGFYTNSDCSTGRLAAEREYYASTTSTSVFWVKQSSISTSTDTTFYMCYGDSSISTDPNTNTTYGATSTWDSNYKGVWHLPNGTALTATDSTSNSHNGTITSATATTGKVDGAAYFSSAKIAVGNSADFSFATGDFALSAWVKTTDTVVQVAFGRYIGGDNYWLGSGVSAGQAYFSVQGTGIGSTNIADNAWHLISGVRSSGVIYLYVDGVQKNSVSNASSVSPGGNLVIGDFGDSGGYSWDGSIDESRISNIARSADWIKTEYNNQSDPATFITIGAESGGAPATTDSGLVMIINARTVIFNTPKIYIK